jgi:hypothetical protein
MLLVCLLIGLLVVCQAGLGPASGGAEALLFSQCNVAWRSFVWAGGSGCQSFDSSGFFFSAKMLQRLRKIFDLWSSRCLLLYSPSWISDSILF